MIIDRGKSRLIYTISPIEFKQQISKDLNDTRYWAYHTYCDKYHPEKCIDRFHARTWAVPINDCDMSHETNDSYPNELSVACPDHTVTIECRKISNIFMCDLDISVLSIRS